MAPSANNSLRKQERKSTTANCKQDILTTNNISSSTVLRLKRKNSKSSSGFSSSHCEISISTQHVTKLDTTSFEDSAIGAVVELETIAQIQPGDELLDTEERSQAIGINRGASHDRTNVTSAVTGIIEYKVYRRRYFGLFQLVLLNIIVSWDVSSAHILYFPTLS